MDEDMDEEYEPILPQASELPPLKRLWVDPQESESVAPALPSTKKKKPAEAKAPSPVEKPKKKKAQAEEVIDDGTGAIKLEATPALDTYEARQYARWIFSGIIAAILGVVLIVLLNAFKGNSSEEVRFDPEPVETRVNSDAKANTEREARIMLDQAKLLDKQGKTKTAVSQLDKVKTVYKGTAAAREATAALDRYQREQSLFDENSSNQAGLPKPTPPGSAPGPVPPRVDGLASNSANSVGVKPPAGGNNPAPPVTAAPPVQPILTKPLPIGYRAKFDYPIHPSGWPTRIACEKDGAEMVLVPAASFIMGRDDGDDEQEKPAHEVAVSTYYIDLHEVTVGQYLRFLKDSGRALDVVKIAGNGKPVDEDLPMVNVSSKEATAYCTWARRRLPTEAEWELAARGPEGKISFWHEQLLRPDPEKGDRKMWPVMSLKEDLSPYGAFDMAANAWEWTSEFYDSRYYRQFRNLVQDPTGPKVPPAKPALGTVKGGSSRGILSWRKGLRLEFKLPYVGFRGALRADGSPLNPVVPAGPANVGPAGGGGVQPF